VLCYHRIGGPHELGATRVATSVFGRQMRALAGAGWRTLRLADFTSRLDTRDASPAPVPDAFLLTFDDGYASLAETAYPLLADLGFTATTFLITDFMGRPNTWDVRYTRHRLRHLDWDTAEQWHARGFDFASHGTSHRRLTWLDDAAVTAELLRSREMLCARLGAAAGSAVAYPFGAADARVRRIAAAVGYRVGFASVAGSATDRLGLRRLPVYAWDRWAPPLVWRDGGWGRLGRTLAWLANRCAVGSSLMLRGVGRR